jgi:copper transport protein
VRAAWVRAASTRGARVFVVAVVLVIAAAAPAAAHAVLLTTNPQAGASYDTAPTSIDLRFNEPVEVSLGGIRLYDGDAARVVTGAPHHPAGDDTHVAVSVPDISHGTYVVTWRVISADSHPVEGAFTFQVGAQATVRNPEGLAARLLSTQSGSTAVGATYAVQRAALFGALALLVGSVVFLVVVFPRGRSLARARRLVWAGWIATAVATIVGIALEGIYAAGLRLTDVFDPQVFRDTLDTRYGRVALLRLALLLVALPLLRMLLRSRTRLPSWWYAAAAVVGGGLVLTPALAGHASTGEHVALAIPADAVHVAAMSCWLGGLVVLFAVVMSRRDPDELREVLPRFSAVALGAIAALVVTGGFQAWRQVGSIAALKETDYGRILLVKLVAFAALIVAAAFSREVVNRRFRAALDDEDDEHDLVDDEVDDQPGGRLSQPVPVAIAAGTAAPAAVGGSRGDPGAATVSTAGDGAVTAHLGGAPPDVRGGDDGEDGDDFDDEVRRLRWSVFAEVAIAVVILIVTALLVNAAPARTVTNEPVSLNLRSRTVWVDVTIAPGVAGANDMHITALPVGGGLTTVDNMQVQLTKPGTDLPPFTVPLQQLGPGHYYAAAYDIPYPGEWQMTVRTQTGPTDEVVLTGRFSLR